jgi:hypothetical protein
MIGKINLIFY